MPLKAASVHFHSFLKHSSLQNRHTQRDVVAALLRVPTMMQGFNDITTIKTDATAEINKLLLLLHLTLLNNQHLLRTQNALAHHRFEDEGVINLIFESLGCQHIVEPPPK